MAISARHMDTRRVSIAAPEAVPMHHIKITSRGYFENRVMPDGGPEWSARSDDWSNFVVLCIFPFLQRSILLKYYNQSDDRQTQLSFFAKTLGDLTSCNTLFLLDL